MTGSYYWYDLKAVASCCLLAFFAGCADTNTSSDSLKPILSTPPSQSKDTSSPGDITSRTQIFLTAKEGIDSKQIENFINYLGCRVIKNVPEGGNLYIVEVPPTINAQNILPKLTSHPWIITATIKNKERP